MMEFLKKLCCEAGWLYRVVLCETLVIFPLFFKWRYDISDMMFILLSIQSLMMGGYIIAASIWNDWDEDEKENEIIS